MALMEDIVAGRGGGIREGEMCRERKRMLWPMTSHLWCWIMNFNSLI